MYTKELKNEITSKLMDASGSTNKWIYRTSYVDRHNLHALLGVINEQTRFVISNRLDERIYCILNDVYRLPTCYCGNTVKFKRFQLGYAQYCSIKCRAADPNWQEQVSNTNLQKYGVTHIAKLSSERDKRSVFMKLNRPIQDTQEAAYRRKQTIERLYGKDYNSGWNTQAIETRINNNHMVPIELLDEYREYYKQVVLLTKKQNLKSLPNIEKRGVLGKDIDAHHIDHIVSIYDGFMNDIPAHVIGHICNLQCIPGKDNIKKGNNSNITIEELYERYNQYKC